MPCPTLASQALVGPSCGRALQLPAGVSSLGSSSTARTDLDHGAYTWFLELLRRWEVRGSWPGFGGGSVCFHSGPLFSWCPDVSVFVWLTLSPRLWVEGLDLYAWFSGSLLSRLLAWLAALCLFLWQPWVPLAEAVPSLGSPCP